jgi:hypothetical protein
MKGLNFLCKLLTKEKQNEKNIPNKAVKNGHNLTTHMLLCSGVEPSTLSRNICVVGRVSRNKPVRKVVVFVYGRRTVAVNMRRVGFL